MKKVDFRIEKTSSCWALTTVVSGHTIGYAFDTKTQCEEKLINIHGCNIVKSGWL